MTTGTSAQPPKGSQSARGPSKGSTTSAVTTLPPLDAAQGEHGRGAISPQSARGPGSKPTLSPLSEQASDGIRLPLGSLPMTVRVKERPAELKTPVTPITPISPATMTSAKSSSSGFRKESTLRAMYDAQMLLYRAGAPLSKPEPELSAFQTEKEEKTRAVAAEQEVLSPRSRAMAAMKERTRQKKEAEQEDLLRALRALRARSGPRGWDAIGYVHFQNEFAKHGKSVALSGLKSWACKSSRAALDARSYEVGKAQEADLPLSNQYSWYDKPKVGESEEEMFDTIDAPPLIVSAYSSVECAAQLRRQYPDRAVFLNVEATDFNKDGTLKGMESKNKFQQEMFMRTTIEANIKAATQTCKGGETMQMRLQRRGPTQMLIAGEVLIFRDSAEEGFGYFSERDQTQCTVLVTGRQNPRPFIATDGELFANPEDALAFVDRLQALGQCADDLGKRTDISAGRESVAGKPFLVIAAQGLGNSWDPQPRDSIAKLLKTWRQMAHVFEGVIVACGDRETAAKLDVTINLDIYEKALDSRTMQANWDWPVLACAFSITPVLAKLARSYHGYVEQPACPSPVSVVSPVASPRRVSRPRLNCDSMFEEGIVAPSESTSPMSPGGHSRMSVGTEGRRQSAISARMNFIDSATAELAVRPRKSANVWTDSYLKAQRIKEAKEEMEMENDEELREGKKTLSIVVDSTKNSSRLAVEHMKQRRISSANASDPLLANWRQEAKEAAIAVDKQAAKEKAEKDQRTELLVAQIAVTLLAMKGEQRKSADMSGAALGVPREVVRAVAREQNDRENRYHNDGMSEKLAAADGKLFEMQMMASDLDEKLRARQDAIRTTEKLKEERLRGGPVNALKWE